MEDCKKYLAYKVIWTPKERLHDRVNSEETKEILKAFQYLHSEEMKKRKNISLMW